MRDNKQNEIESNQSLHGKVFDQLKNGILNGKYKHGDLLNEVKMAEEMGVSRTPVREALRQLELEGLAAYTPNKGVVVRGLSREDIKDIYQIRLMIEGMTARRAAENITEEELAELKEYIELEEFYTGRDDVKQLSRLDSCFHETIYKACGRQQHLRVKIYRRHINWSFNNGAYMVYGPDK
jgi:DNA-binding GntR family transcriptional regulator